MADIAAQLGAAPAALSDDGWRRRAGRALAVKAAEIARLEGWLLRHAPTRVGVGAAAVPPDELARWEAAVFERPGRGA